MPTENTVRHCLENFTPLTFESSYLTDDLRKRAKLELYEDEDTRVNSLKLLRSMLKDEKDLYYQDEDQFLLQFLRARKFDVKRAYNLVRNFYTVKAKYGELYDDFDYDTVQKTIEENFIGFLPYRDKEGSVILVLRAGVWDPTVISMTEMMRTLTSGLVMAIRNPATQIAGFKVIVDFKGFTVRHLPHVSPSYLWLFADALQNCFPARFRAVHVVNEGHLFSYIWSILKQLLTKKLRERFHFHGKNVSKLHKYFDPSILPEEYQGEMAPFDNSDWGKKMLSQSNYITKLYTSYGYTKTLRKNKNELKKVEDD